MLYRLALKSGTTKDVRRGLLNEWSRLIDDEFERREREGLLMTHNETMEEIQHLALEQLSGLQQWLENAKITL